MKKILSLLVMAVWLTAALPVYAAETPTATFDGSSEIKYNYKDTENFGNAFQGMLPGDERVQEIILKNTSPITIAFFMEVEVIRALEETYQETKGAGYDFSLSVTQDGVNGGKPQMIYSGSPTEDAWIGADEKGLKNINEMLENYGAKGLQVATLAQDEQAVIALKVTLDGVSGRNEYQDVNGTFQFAFHASYDTPGETDITEKDPEEEKEKTSEGEESSEEEEARTEEERQTTGSSTGSSTVTDRTSSSIVSKIAEAVRTGDTTVIVPLVLLLAASIAVILLVLRRKKK